MDRGTSEDKNSAAPALTLELLSKSYRDMSRAALGFAENALTEYMDFTKKLGSVKRPDEKEEKSKIFKDPAWLYRSKHQQELSRSGVTPFQLAQSLAPLQL